MGLDLNQYRHRVAVTDGAWGTQLQQRGLPAGMCPELWNLENPAAVESVARSYVDAGSEIILTNTFGANAFTLGAHGLADRVAELAERGAAISRAAAGDSVRVFGSIGPTGKVVMMQEVAEGEFYATFADAARGLAAGGVDAIVIETMTEPAESALAVRAIRDNTDLPVIASFTFDSGPDKTVTMMGAAPERIVAEFEDLGVAAFGANCGVGPESYVKVIELYRAATNLPLWVKPNAGLPELVDGKNVFRMDPKKFAHYIRALAAAGANFIGGCCGTTPEHLKVVRNAVDGL